jgi:uncharacterized protein (DUF342 family)
MAYYLHHYFDPDFKHEKLTPQFEKGDTVTFLYLGYVQNVVAGQVLAEVLDLDKNPELADCDPRFVSSEPYFPCGPNCAPHPGKPTRMIATTNGYCFYNDGLITVKNLLNIRSDIDLHTGNIMFVGDVIAHKAVRAGFSVYGNNILIKGTVENATIKATANLVCESGIKGSGEGLLESGGNIKLPFCENIHIHTGGNAEIDGTCLHSNLHIGGSLMVKGRLHGGNAYAKSIIYVKDQLGGSDIKTSLTLGFDPAKIRRKVKLESQLAVLTPLLEQLENTVEKKPEKFAELDFRIRLLRRKMKIQHEQLKSLTQKLNDEAKSVADCKIICQGNIEPGVEITIGEAHLVIKDYLRAQEFKLENGEIISTKLG